jgi:hypothetical protein
VGWKVRRTPSLLPVDGEVFLLTLPFIERAYRTSSVLARNMSGNLTYRELIQHCRGRLLVRRGVGVEKLAHWQEF